MTSIKDYNSVTNKQNMEGSKPNLDLINRNAFKNLVKFYPFVLEIL